MNQKKAGVLLSYTSEAIKILTSLLYTPIMLRLLGQSEYGLYQLVGSVVSYLGLLSLGFTSAYVRYFSLARAKGTEKEVERLNGFIKSKEAKLSGSFVEKAPAQVVAKERESLDDLRMQRDVNLQTIERLRVAANARK